MAGARAVLPQLRTTDLEGSIRRWAGSLGCKLGLRYGDCCAGIPEGGAEGHLKRLDHPMRDAIRVPSVGLVRQLHGTAWGARESVLRDDQGHTIHVGEARADAAPGRDREEP